MLVNSSRLSATRPLARSFATLSQRERPQLKVNQDRLMEMIHDTAKWGAAHPYGEHATQTGMARLALSDDDGKARRWFADKMKSLDCEVVVDQMGNQFARRAGSLRSDQPMTAMGSHLDTQPRGGRYDGILGVLAAVEAMTTLKEAGYQTQYDVGVVNWTNEEGARFPKSMLSSGVWAGDIPLETAWALPDINDPSTTLKAELERLGMLGDIACSHEAGKGYPLGAHFELHIEQGPILERTGKKIGVVQGVQGYRWFTFTVTGRDAHTGTTPLNMRKDPLLAAARIISQSHNIAKSHGGLASTGIFKTPTNSSTNTIMSQVAFSLDIRHPEDEVVNKIQEQCISAFNEVSQEEKVQLDWTIDTDTPATKFDPDCIATVEQVAERLAGRDGWLHMTSGAGHDSVYTSRWCPTTMIFVACKDGVSHHPEEYSSPEDCAIGAQALMEAAVDYDLRRASR